jgi:hypothetical protein
MFPASGEMILCPVKGKSKVVAPGSVSTPQKLVASTVALAMLKPVCVRQTINFCALLPTAATVKTTELGSTLL